MLDRVSITGADDQTDIGTLLQWSEYYPWVEWAILFSPSREGNPRYPSAEWRAKFEAACKGKRVKRAMHLCGQAVKDFQQKGPAHLPCKAYQRVQLNFNAKSSNWKNKKDLEWLASQCGWAEFWDGSPQGIIIQHNANNADALPLFHNLGTQLHVLHDASGGHGKVLDTHAGPWHNFYTGYAGGINPENCVEHFYKIQLANKANYWMDMESGVRTDDAWDPQKVNSVLKQLSTFIGV